MSAPAGMVRLVENEPLLSAPGCTQPLTTQPPWEGTCPGCQVEELPMFT